MTDVSERSIGTAVSRPPEAPAAPGAPERGATTPAPSTRAPAVLVSSAPGRLVLGAASLGAGAIHLAMVPAHAAESPALGAGFAVAGWVQILIALRLVVPPRRRVVAVATAAQVTFVAAYVLSRTTGLPFGLTDGAEAVGSIDLTCAVLEGVAILAGVVLLARPQAGGGVRSATFAFASLIAVGVVLVASFAITSPSASQHAHAMVEGGSTADGSAHDHAATNGPAGTDAAVHDHATEAPYQPLDLATQQTLTDQMNRARAVTAQYPTVKDVVAAGAQRISVFTPGSGAHYMFPIGSGAFSRLTFDPDLPLMLLYSGNDDTSVVVGAMYLTFGPGASAAPEGFAGPNDHWHMHQGACISRAAGAIDLLLPVDQDATRAECDAVGGRFLDITPWMIHVWTAPGWESPQGVFSHDNSLLVCTDGNTTAHDDFVKGCKGLG